MECVRRHQDRVKEELDFLCSLEADLGNHHETVREAGLFCGAGVGHKIRSGEMRGDVDSSLLPFHWGGESTQRA